MIGVGCGIGRKNVGGTARVSTGTSSHENNHEGDAVNLSRQDAWALVTEYTQSESLRKHMLAVAAAVRGYARMWGENEEEWGVVALLHDFDYERWPDQQNHPFRGVAILKEKGYPEWVTRAILSHAEYSGVPRQS